MIPRTYPTEYITAGGQTRIVVYALTSVAGLTAWVDYIPVKGIPEEDESTALENTYAVDGYMIMRSSESTTGLTAWVDYLPVYEDVTATIPWSTDVGGYIPASGLYGIASLFAAGEEGVWYDPSDFSTLYQDSAGTTPVTAVEQPVGLMLDKSKGLALGATLVTNGTFDSGIVGWESYVGTASWDASGKLAINGPTQFDGAKTIDGYVTGLVIGRIYKLSADIELGTAVSAKVEFYNPTMIARIEKTSNGNYSQYFTATATSGTIYAVTGTGSTGTAYFDNISVKEVLGNHATQATSASRPTLSARVNLLTYSEQFDNAVWNKQQGIVTSNAAIAPDGTTTADKFTPNTASNVAHTPNRAVTAINGTASIYAKAAGENYIGIKLVAGTITVSNTVVFNLSAGTISNATGNTASIEDVGNGWYRCSVTFASITNFIPVTTADGVTFYYTGNASDGIYIWGASLVPEDQADLPYQRIAAATDYDTVGFKHYLKFDGVDDSLATGSIDFSAGDKMTVFAGMRKLSDAGLYATIVELSTTCSTNNGTFTLNTPWNSGNFGTGIRGTAYNNGITSAGSQIAPASYVATGLFNIGGAATSDELNLRLNSVAQSLTRAGSASTGNFGNYPLYIGRRGTGAYPFTGHLYSLIVRAAESTATDITNAETWVNGKTGAY